MKISSMKFENFRNIADLQLDFCDGVNVFCGENAQGKTNIIEGISVLGGAKSFRTSKDRELVKNGEEKAVLEASFFSNGRNNTLKTEISSGKTVYINGLEEEKLNELYDRYFCVVFSPDHLSMIKDGPEKRRKFIDMCISRISPKYTQYLSDYEHVLFQRNNLIRNIKYSFDLQKKIDSELSIWDMSLANLGCVIHNMRKKYMKRLSDISSLFYDGISGGREKMSLSYVSTVFEKDIEDKKEQRDIFYNRLRAAADEDIKNGFTSIGVQRDDFNVIIDEKNARLFASQGQQRSAVLALKMGECDIISESFNEKPVVLLDDVMSELDRKRQNFVMNCLSDMQVFITCCEINDLKNLKEGKIFSVKNGSIIRQRIKKSKLKV